MVSKELLHELFEYRDGELYWKKSFGKKIKIGSKVGSISSCGYLNVGLNNKKYLNHRLIFLMFHGYLPKEIDHIDCNRLNNKIENLREATRSQNFYNRKLQKNNTSGIKGVSWYKPLNKWRVQLRVNNHIKHIGYFDDLELADLVATEARSKYHGNFANH